MIIDKEIEIKWNARNKKHYVDLGYEYTKIGDTFKAKLEDLTIGCNSKIKIKCDYCGQEFETKCFIILKRQNKEKDCCSNPKCTGEKAKESLIKKYGVSNCRYVNGVNEKIKNTCLEKYGSDNPFGNKQIIEKIRKTNLMKYGVEVPTQNKDVISKVAKTLKKYYEDNPNKKLKGEKSPSWKGENVKIPRNKIRSVESRKWREKIFHKNNYTCQKCLKRGGQVLNAHHIYNWAKYEELRFDINNGITLCEKCHIKFHSIYGKKDNNPNQLKEFLNN